MGMKYRIFIGLIAIECLVLFVFFFSGVLSLRTRHEELLEKRDLVQRLFLTDLSLWTEARYTRNPSQADVFSAFQDFPSAIEHFPAGSIIAPPAHLRKGK